MLSFLSPLFLVGAAAAAVPVVLHFLNRQPDARVKFSAVKLLRLAPVEHTQKRRLRQLLLLALRIATLILLALAFARPFFASGAAVASSAVTIVALDTSYSMSAPGRFEKAKELALAAIDRAPAGALVGVVSFSDQAEIAAKPTADRVLARTAVTEAAAGFGATRYRAALSAAVQNLSGRQGTIVVVTDLQENGWDAGDRVAVPENARIEVADVGQAPAGLSITAIRVLNDRLVAMVRNAGARARDVRVHLTIDDRRSGEAAVSLAPNQSGEATFAGPPRGLAAAVSVDDPDGLQADNIRYAVLSGRTQPAILVITSGGELNREGFYLQHALTAGVPPSAAYRVTSMSGAQLSAAAKDVLTPFPAIILLSTRGLERRGREALATYARNGGGLLVAVGPEVDGEVVADVLGSESSLQVATLGVRPGSRALAPADVRHPIFQPFAVNPAVLGLVTFDTVARIGGSACQTLARFTTGDPALIECPAGDGRAMVLASDLGNRWNDFPLHATFVPFVQEVVRYLASARTHAAEYVVAAAPAGIPRKPGVFMLPDVNPAAPPRRIAVNIDPREADPSRLSVDEFLSAVTKMQQVAGTEARVEARQQEDDQHLWQYVLVLMTAALVLEGVVAARTV